MYLNIIRQFCYKMLKIFTNGLVTLCRNFVEYNGKMFSWRLYMSAKSDKRITSTVSFYLIFLWAWTSAAQKLEFIVLSIDKVVEYIYYKHYYISNIRIKNPKQCASDAVRLGSCGKIGHRRNFAKFRGLVLSSTREVIIFNSVKVKSYL